MYADVTVVVDGALEEEEQFTDDTLLNEFVERIRLEQLACGYPVAIYVLEHDHDPPGEDDEPCSCIQYVQDHRPRFEFP